VIDPISSTRFISPLACLKLAAGWIAFFLVYPRYAPADPIYFYPLHIVMSGAFAVTAAILLIGGRHDARARHLGVFFLVAATAWSNGPLRDAYNLHPGVFVLPAINAVELDCFIPLYLWAFARDFPSPPVLSPNRRRLDRWVTTSWVVGLALFLFNLAYYVVKALPDFASVASWLRSVTPMRAEGLYYYLVMGLTGCALAGLLWRIVKARGQDRRRAQLLLAVLVATLAPIVIEVGLEYVSTTYQDFIRTQPTAYRWLLVATVLPAMAFPITIPYTILVHRVLDVRSIAQRAFHYALARASVATITLVPLGLTVAYVVVHRDERVSSLFTGSRVPLLLALAALGFFGYRFSKRLLDFIDRRFFREQYDARHILTLLVDRIRSVHEIGSLATLVSREIDLALHLEGIAMLVLQPKIGVLVDPKTPTRRLDASSLLALTISNAVASLEVDLDDPRSPLQHLPEKERHWLVDSGFRLIVPILARDGSLVGLVGLGEKKSRLPFLREDRQLLHAIASSAAWVLEMDPGRFPSPDQALSNGNEPRPPDTLPPSLEAARECLNCGLVHPTYTVFCGGCSRKLTASHVPYVLPNKYRFEKRIGVGGMGIVYQAIDLGLGRHVAIKTLRKVSPEAAVRLRHEARTAATFTHPNLAAVYGLETWQGTPMLIMELLEGGTLAQRISLSPLAPLEAVEIGIAMADALARLHAGDVLHRDVKPSNIGYSGEGTPKLMDFGIARTMLEVDDDSDLPHSSTVDEVTASFPSLWDTASQTASPTRRRFAGTLSYLSPEALEGDLADASFDLWALSVVLYECLLGRKVFGGGDTRQIVQRIQQGRAPDFYQAFCEGDAALAGFFRTALHKSIRRRPGSAHELRHRLEELHAHLRTCPWAAQPLREAAGGS
jgi:hypothetical protein